MELLKPERLYLADRDGGTTANEPSVAVIRRFNMQTGAPAGEIRVERSAWFNDIEVADDGTIYATQTGDRSEKPDPATWQVWKIAPDGSASIFVPDESEQRACIRAARVIGLGASYSYRSARTGEMRDARQLIALLEPHGRDARTVAEFGIGTNDRARLTGVILEDEKVMGTIHIAFGDNKSMGGSVRVASHLDGLVKQPTVWFDERRVIDAGRLLEWLFATFTLVYARAAVGIAG